MLTFTQLCAYDFRLNPGQMNLNFFAAGNEDVETAFRMQQNFYGDSGYPFDPNTAKDTLRLFIEDSHFGKLWLIMANGKTAGYVALTLGFSFEFKGRDAFLDELYVLPEFRSNGIGTKTIEFVSQKAKEMGIKALHLEVEVNNDAGKALYRNFDFQDHNRILMTRWLV